jgi:hypothetical protein
MVSMSEKQLRDAFDRITPSDETKQSMLDNILKAAANEQIAEPIAEPLAEPIAQQAASIIPLAPRRRKRSKFLDAALPIAACLVLLAGVGSLTLPELFTDPARYAPTPTQAPEPAPAPAPAEPTEPTEDPEQVPSETQEPSDVAPDEPQPAPSAVQPSDAEAVDEAPVSIDAPVMAMVVPSNEPSLQWIVSIAAIAISLLTLIIWACYKLVSRRTNKE